MLSMRRIAVTFLAVTALAQTACDAPPVPPPVVPGDDDDEPDPPDPDVVIDCANANPDTTAVDLEQMAARFATDVFPLWTRAEGGCVACHASDSDRLMKMADATSTPCDPSLPSRPCHERSTARSSLPS